MTGKELDKLAENICSEIEAGMSDVGSWEGYLPQWAWSVLESVLGEVKVHVRSALKSAIDREEMTISSKHQQQIDKLKVEHKELKKELKEYAAVKKLLEEARSETGIHYTDGLSK